MDANINYYYFAFTSVSIFTFVCFGSFRLKQVFNQIKKLKKSYRKDKDNINNEENNTSNSYLKFPSRKNNSNKYEPLISNNDEQDNEMDLRLNNYNNNLIVEIGMDSNIVTKEGAMGAVPGFNIYYLIFCTILCLLQIIGWIFEYCRPILASNDIFSMNHQILCICNSTLWFGCIIWSFFAFYYRKDGVSPTFGFLGAWWAVQSISTPLLLLSQDIKVWDEDLKLSYLSKIMNVIRLFSPTCLFFLTVPIFVEALFVYKNPKDRLNESALSTNGHNRKTSASRLWNLTRKHRQWLISGCIVLLVRLPFSLSIPHFISQVIGGLVSEPKNLSLVKESIISIFIAGTIDSFLDFWCVYLFGVAQQKIILDLRRNVFKALLSQDMEFHDVTSSGEMTSRLTADCAEMANDLTWVFRFFIEALVRIGGIMGYMLVRSWRLSLLALSIIPITSLINVFYGKWMWKNQARVQTAIAEANSVAQEVLGAIRTVFSFAREDEEHGRYSTRLVKWYDLMVLQLFIQGVYYGMCNTFLINTCVQGSLLIYGSWLVQQGALKAEILLAFMLYQGQLQEYFQNLFNSYTSLIKSFGAGKKVFEYLDRTPRCKRPGKNNDINSDILHTSIGNNNNNKNNMGDIHFHNVSFAYPSRPEAIVLRNFKMTVKEGEMVALVGPSGAGKSTVFHLLQHFYDPDEGAIFVGNKNLKNYNHHALHNDFAIVGQEPTLMSGNIEDNILYGLGGMDTFSIDEKKKLRKNVVACAKLANAHNFIVSLPNGYETDVGEKGVQLSGGQKQRIAIARCLIQDPKVLLLDEATSALDSESEALVQEALEKAMHGRTTIVIAHRLSTVSKADRIYVLASGSIVEEGTHKKLMQKPTPIANNRKIGIVEDEVVQQHLTYRQLVERQSGF